MPGILFHSESFGDDPLKTFIIPALLDNFHFIYFQKSKFEKNGGGVPLITFRFDEGFRNAVCASAKSSRRIGVKPPSFFQLIE